jgi:peptide/nickel transport system substrate-binding protein
MVLAGCGPAATTGGSTSGPHKGGTAIDGLFEEPDSLLPQGSVETFSDLVDAAIWAPLYYGDNTGVIQAGLASEVPSTSNGGISADGLTYTIKLRSGLKWSDGTPLTSDDVAFTFNLFKNPAFGAKSGFQGSEIASVTATDPTTVQVKLTKLDVTFLAISLTDPLGFAPLPKSVYGSMDPASILKSDNNFWPKVTSGPFKISDRVQADHINTVRNDNYYQAGKPYLDGVNFKIIPDQNTILTALQSGSITNTWFADVTKMNTYKTLPGYKVTLDKTSAAFEWIVFNLHNPILADVNVRKALTMSADPSQIINGILNGTATTTCDDSVGSFAHEPSLIPCYKYDTTAAGKLLDQAGWTMGSDGYRHKNGKILELGYATTANNARRSATQQVFQSQWKQVGVKIDIQNYPAATYFGQILPSGKFDLGEFEDSLGYDPDDSVLFQSDQTAANGGSNYGFYSNPTVDAAIKTEQGSPDINVRKQAFHTIHTQILADVPVFYLYAPRDVAVVKTTLQNYAPSPSGPSETWNIWDWYFSA